MFKFAASCEIHIMPTIKQFTRQKHGRWSRHRYGRVISYVSNIIFPYVKPNHTVLGFNIALLEQVPYTVSNHTTITYNNDYVPITQHIFCIFHMHSIIKNTFAGHELKVAYH